MKKKVIIGGVVLVAIVVVVALVLRGGSEEAEKPEDNKAKAGETEKAPEKAAPKTEEAKKAE